MSTAEATWVPRTRLLNELSEAFGIGPITAVAVAVSGGPEAAWLVSTARGDFRLKRATLRTGGSQAGSLDAWRREVTGNKNLPALIDERGAVLSMLHRLSSWGTATR